MCLRSLLCVAILLLLTSAASAQTFSFVVDRIDSGPFGVATRARGCPIQESRGERAWRVAVASAVAPARTRDADGLNIRWTSAWLTEDTRGQVTVRRRPKAIEYSGAYATRMKIHRYASLATLPLAITEIGLGQALYTNPTSGKRGAHTAVATGIAGLFGVNSVTGVWNLLEARKDGNGKTRRMLHGILMLAADAGFLATAALAPEGEHEFEHGPVPIAGTRSPAAGRARHRAVALTSLGTALTSYVMMLVWRP